MEVRLRRHHHLADAGPEVQQFIDIGTVFFEDILAGDTDVGGTPLDVDRHIGGLDPEVADPGLLVLEDEFPVLLADGGAFVAGGLEHGVDLFAEAALRERDVNHLFQGLRPPYC